MEFAGARYHLINRGNYRSNIFESEGARRSFVGCLDEACESMQWRLYAWCLMSNHYHLCVETPHPNLVEGMRWLQSTFANRFNRYRKANGHVFQGRYKAILLEGQALGAVCHYIHLNPVRAGLAKVSSLQSWTESSFARLWHPSRRRRHDFPELALEFAGGLSDSPMGRRKYREYLSWLSASSSEQKRLCFESMTRGWIKGSAQFRQSVLDKLDGARLERVCESEASDMREALWERTLEEGLRALGRTADELSEGLKGAAWKVALARYLRQRRLTPYGWLSENLSMGKASYVQSLVSRHRSGAECKDWRKLKKHGKLD